MNLLRCFLPILLGSIVLSQSVSDASAQSWESVAPQDAGFVAELPDLLAKSYTAGELPNLHGVVVARGDKLVLEQYFTGEDESWGSSLGTITFGPEVMHDLRSVSKSIVGLLYGIALGEGKVPAIDAPLVDQFPYKDLAGDPDRRRITVKHALTMTLGLKWDESLPYTDPRNSEIAMEMAKDRYRYILEQPIVSEPGSKWHYSGGSTALLAHLIARGTGQQLHDYAKEKLFGPLGIDNSHWTSGTNGEPAAASGLRLTARDLARVGRMILNKGQWNGNQIVPADWLAESFVQRVTSESGLFYGYQWWLGNGSASDRPWMAGFGNGGQRLVMIPHLDLVLVVFAGNYNDRDAWKLAVRIMTEIIFPSLR